LTKEEVIVVREAAGSGEECIGVSIKRVRISEKRIFIE
jgi:predicted RNA-binding protein